MPILFCLLLCQAAIADFSVLLFEAVSLDVPSALLSEAGLSSPAALVGLKAWRAIRQLRAMCDCALWRDVQSRFIHVSCIECGVVVLHE